MEGLFQLLIIVFFIVAAIFDATKRNRERQRRQEQMETEEALEEGQMEDRAAAEAREQRRRRKAPMGRDDDAPSPEGRDEPATVARSGGPERETADELVPEDLWAILTGQPRTREPEPDAPVEAGTETAEPRTRPTGPAPASEREGRGRVGEGRFDPLPKRPHTPEPTPSERLSEITHGAGTQEAARPTRRSARWVEGVEAERNRVAAEEAAAFGSIADEEPWNRFEDISAGEILDGEGRVQAAGDPGGARSRPRRGAGRGQYTRLLETGKQEDLRKAIVLREVLGPPVGFRDPGNGD